MIQESAEEAQAREVAAAAVPIVVQGAARDLQDHQEITGSQENRVLPEIQVKLDVHQSKPVSKLLHPHVTHVPLDHQDHQEAQEPQEMQDQTETPDKEAVAHNLGRQDLKAHLDHQDQTVTPEALDSQEHQLKAKKPDQEPQDQQETLDHQDHQDQLEVQDNQEGQDNQEAKGPAGIPELRVTMDSQDNQDHLDNQEAPVKRVSVRNTALSTVESSSKMEHADVKSSSFKTHTRGDLPKTPCPMNQQFPFLLLVAQKTAIYYVSLYCIQDWGFLRSLFFLK